MKKNIIKIVLIAFIIVLSNSCAESAISEDSYVNLPASTITEVSNETPFVGTQIVLKGTNMQYVSSVAFGPYNFKIIKKTNDNISV